MDTEQQERLATLITLLVQENPRWQTAWETGELAMPDEPQERYRLYRSLVNVRPPEAPSAAYLACEDAYLQHAAAERGAVTLDRLAPILPGSPAVYLWQGDITRLAVDAIVNAANSQMLGCFVPCHGCIDNAIHTAAGVRLRLACDELMLAQGAPEATGRAKLTSGFNLPAAHVIHTVGPIVQGPRPTARDRELLAQCYRSCLDCAIENDLHSIAFCCISTGEFHFPPKEAARIAVDTVLAGRAAAMAAGAHFPEVVFDVFTDADLANYRDVLRQQ